MSTSTRPLASISTTGVQTQERSYFEQQRELLLREIGTSFEHVLANINKLNRSLEAVTAVGNEFSSVEALWSQFEGVMGKEDVIEGGESREGNVEGEEQEEGETVGSVDGEEIRYGEEEDSTILEEKEGRRRR